MTAAARPPRILIDALTYASNDGGFAEGMHGLLDSCRSLTEFEVIVAHHPRFREEFARHGLELTSVPFPFRLRYLLQPFLLPWLTRRAHADLVLCENTALPPFTGAPGLVTVHDLHFMKPSRVEDKTWRQRLLAGLYWRGIWAPSIRRAAALKAISQIAATETREMLHPRVDIAVIPVRVDVGPEYPPQTWPAEGEPVRLLWLGHVVPRKNIGFLLASLHGFQRDWRLDIVGNTWWDADAIGAESLRDPRITVHGFVSREEKERFYEHAHILIAPSIDEGFGRTPAEAFARSRLALTSDIAAFREYVPEACRFSLDDPHSLMRLYNSLDAERYAALVASGADIRERFGVAAHIRAHRDLFQRMVAAPR
ncbi:MAG: hypothetical protein CVU47_12685 [Chloroflexi bacterium HGW-Chloroflexi-9]|nr:MAG: hypothetical protein CVU47_12685 [Chloroflexi bacterium HGW-Chloroflexi-9]